VPEGSKPRQEVSCLPSHIFLEGVDGIAVQDNDRGVS
jgi:hypothetical protein